MPNPKLHATCLALKSSSGQWSAAIFCGPSGSGKSDLALRILHDLGDERARLVADDVVELEVTEDAVFALSPNTMQGKLEVRGIGILDMPHLDRAEVAVCYELAPPDEICRLPEPSWFEVNSESRSARVPLYKLAPFEASAVAKVVEAHRAHTELGAKQQ